MILLPQMMVRRTQLQSGMSRILLVCLQGIAPALMTVRVGLAQTNDLEKTETFLAARSPVADVARAE